MESGAHKAGYELLVANTGYSAERLLASIRLMIGRRVEGLAAIVSEMDSNLVEELTRSRILVVFYDVGTRRHGVTNIRVDYRHGMEKLISYLYSSNPALTAIVCVNDLMAVGTLIRAPNSC